MPDPPPAHLRRTDARLRALLDVVRANGDLPPDVRSVVVQELTAAREDLRAAEEELAASVAAVEEGRERFVELFEFAPDAYVETDERGSITIANQAAARLLGIPARLLPGTLLVSSVHADDRRRFRRLVARAGEDEAIPETRLRLATGDDRVVEVGVVVVRQEHPALTSVQLRWMVRDLTDRLALQGQVDDLTDEVDLLVRVAEVERLAGEDDPLEATLRGVVELARDLLPGCQVGMILVGRSDMERSFSAGPRAAELDERQRVAAEGPCVEAARGTEVVRGRPSDWPVLADVDDVVEVVAVPLLDEGQLAGALGVYAMEAALDASALRLLAVLSRQATVTLRNAALLAASATLAHGLAGALETRGVIERAKGVLMAREGIDADAAFDVLKRASQRENVKLHTLAARLVGDVDAPPPSG